MFIKLRRIIASIVALTLFITLTPQTELQADYGAGQGSIVTSGSIIGNTSNLGGFKEYQNTLMFYTLDSEVEGIYRDKVKLSVDGRDLKDIPQSEKNSIVNRAFADTNKILGGYIGMNDPNRMQVFYRVSYGAPGGNLVYSVGRNYRDQNLQPIHGSCFSHPTLKAILDAKTRAELDSALEINAKHNEQVLYSVIHGEKLSDIIGRSTENYKTTYNDGRESSEKFDRAIQLIMLKACSDFQTSPNAYMAINVNAKLSVYKDSFFKEKAPILYWHVDRIPVFVISKSVVNQAGLNYLVSDPNVDFTVGIRFNDIIDIIFQNRAQTTVKKYFEDKDSPLKDVKDIITRMYNDALKEHRSAFFISHIGKGNSKFPNYLPDNIITNRVGYAYSLVGNVFDGYKFAKRELLSIP